MRKAPIAHILFRKTIPWPGRAILIAVGLAGGLSLLPACQQQVQQPALSDEQIARIMVDLYTAEAATVGLSGFAKDSLSQVYFEQVLTMHNVTREAYEKDLRILVNDLPRLEAIQDRVEEILDPAKKEKEKKEPKAPPLQ